MYSSLSQQEETKQDNNKQETMTKVKGKNELNPSYYIYNNDNISGPYKIDEIIELWRAKKIKNDQMWITSSIREHEDAESKWFKLEFPEYTANDIGKELKDVKQECIDRNKEIKSEFPQLYSYLIQKVLDNEIKRYMEPLDIPNDAKKATSKLNLFIKIVGKLLMITMLILIGLHNMLGLCFLTAIVACCEAPESTMQLVLTMIAISGMITTPILSVSCILSFTEVYDDGIQSWMISWLIWGILAFVIISMYIFGIIRGISEKDKIVKILNRIVLLIIGVDFGNINVEGLLEAGYGENDPWKLFGVFLVFPSLACFMPAAIAGFIANYFLEEQFTLKCSKDTQNNYLCFEEKYGCCQIVSSFDYTNSYIFIGGLASNILAIWAIVRIIGYVMANASPTLTLYAKRKK